MKRRMIAAAMLGVSILGAGNPAVADECKQVRPGESMECREIAAGDLGPSMCLATERFEFRGVKPSTDHDPWVTKEAIKLGAIAFHPTSRSCNAGNIPLGNSTLTIAKSANGYHATLAGATNAEIDMTVTRDSGMNDLWLSGHPASSTVNYFVYFRDQSGTGMARAESAALPKFLVIEALDFNDPSCKTVAPSLEAATSTVKAAPCEHAVGGEPREGGVGGGGEHKGP